MGFQTQLKWGEQQRVFRLIPGLEGAEFIRYGMIHRNTFINAPTVLLPTWQTRANLNSCLPDRYPESRGMSSRPHPVSWPGLRRLR